MIRTVLKTTCMMLVLVMLCACGNAPGQAVSENKTLEDTKPEETVETKEPDRPSEEPKEEVPAETVKEEEKPAQENKTLTRDERVEEYDCAADVLYEYRERQDARYDGYTYYDIDSDGKDELIITCAGKIADIYGWYGNKMRCAFVAYDGHTATIYPGGMLKSVYTGAEGDTSESWYVYYSSLGGYLRALDESKGEYYEVCGWGLEGEALKEIEDSYKNYGYYPEWIGEWFDELTRSQYESRLPKSRPVKLSGIEKLSDIVVVRPNTSGDDIKGRTVALDAATQKKLNIFMSNFSEAGLVEYDRAGRDLTDILHWTLIWTKLNKDKNIERRDVSGKGLCEILSLDNVNAVTEKYLGITISDGDVRSFKPDDTYRLFFDNDDLCQEAADGESYTNLTVVNTAEDLGARRLKITYTVYSQDLDEYFEGKGKDEYYKLTGEEASKNANLEPLWSGYAIVSFDGSVYKLEYLVSE